MRKLSRSHLVAIVAASGVIVALSFGTISAASGGVKGFFGLAKVASEKVGPSVVVAEVDGESITYEGIVQARALMQTSAVNQNAANTANATTLSQAFEQQKAIAVQVAEARRRGFAVTEDEVDGYVQQFRDQYAQGSKEEQAQLREYMDAVGLTEVNYWKQARSTYRDLLLVVKLRNSVYDSVPNSETPDGIRAKMEAYNQFLRELVDNAQVTILRPDLLK